MADVDDMAARLAQLFLDTHRITCSIPSSNPRGEGYVVQVGCSCSWERTGMLPIGLGDPENLRRAFDRHLQEAWPMFLAEMIPAESEAL